MTKAIALEYSGVDRSGFAPDSLFASTSSRGNWPPTYKFGECNAGSCAVKLEKFPLLVATVKRG